MLLSLTLSIALKILLREISSKCMVEQPGIDYSGPFGAICLDFESHHSGE